MKTKYNLAYKRNFIENNKENPIVKNVLDDGITIKKQVMDFYDINLYDGEMDATDRFNPEKSGKTPRSLLKVIEPFSEQGKLNQEFLDYECVREQIKTSVGVEFSGILSLIGLGEKNRKKGRTLKYKEYKRLKESVFNMDEFMEKYKTYEELK